MYVLTVADITCDFDGMSYSECAPSCGASCQSIHAIANGATCRDVCVEGCHCDNGKVLGPGGNCIPESQCPCENNHEWFANGVLIDEGCGTWWVFFVLQPRRLKKNLLDITNVTSPVGPYKVRATLWDCWPWTSLLNGHINFFLTGGHLTYEENVNLYRNLAQGTTVKSTGHHGNCYGCLGLFRGLDPYPIWTVDPN